MLEVAARADVSVLSKSSELAAPPPLLPTHPHAIHTDSARTHRFSLPSGKRRRWVHKLSVEPLSGPASACPDFYVLFNAVGQSLSPTAPEWEQRGPPRPNKRCVCLLCLLFCVFWRGGVKGGRQCVRDLIYPYY